MTNGVVSTITVSSFTLITIFLTIAITLSVKSIRSTEDIWNGVDVTPQIQRLTIITISIFSAAIFVSWVLFIEIMSFGYNNGDRIPQITEMLLAWLSFTGTMLALFVWIKRSQIAFHSTEYAFSTAFMNAIHIMFYVLCVFALATVLTYALSTVSDAVILPFIPKILGGLWGFAFIAEIFAILYAYLSKVSQLKMECRTIVNSLRHSVDQEVADVMTKLTALQIKLSILLVMIIVTTFGCIALRFAFDPFLTYRSLPLSLNMIVSFVCTFCTIPAYDNIYRQVFCLCIMCCRQYSFDELIVISAIGNDKNTTLTHHDSNATATTASDTPDKSGNMCVLSPSPTNKEGPTTPTSDVNIV
eukprot:2958_1